MTRLGGKRAERETLKQKRSRWMDEYVRTHPFAGFDDYANEFPLRMNQPRIGVR